MSTEWTAALKAPFPADKIHWRVGATTKDKDKGIGLAYLNARDVMERLDEVVGVHNWQSRYPYAGCCEISIRFDGEWVTKANGAGETDVEGEKGQYSDAFKRAAVLWGIGRYLYDLPNTWVPIKAQGRSYVLVSPPQLPKWALPARFTPEEIEWTKTMPITEEGLIKLCNITGTDFSAVNSWIQSGEGTVEAAIAKIKKDNNL